MVNKMIFANNTTGSNSHIEKSNNYSNKHINQIIASTDLFEEI